MENETQKYGKELGTGIKEGLKGLNTMASPKKRKTCIYLCFIPIVGMIICMIGGVNNIDFLIGLGGAIGICSGACNFYIGKFKKGILFSLTCGGFMVGSLIDLFNLVVTKTIKDANGFPIIY